MSIRFNSKLMITYSNFKTLKAFLDAGSFLVKTRYGEGLQSFLIVQ